VGSDVHFAGLIFLGVSSDFTASGGFFPLRFGGLAGRFIHGPHRMHGIDREGARMSKMGSRGQQPAPTCWFAESAGGSLAGEVVFWGRGLGGASLPDEYGAGLDGAT